MSVVMGIDASLTSTGWVVIEQHGDGNIIKSGAISSKRDGIERAIEIREELKEIISRNLPQLIYIEGYSFGSKGRSIYQIGELGGLIREVLNKHARDNGTWTEIAPKALKKFATGKGTSKKEDIKLAVFKKWGIEFDTNDETDAFVLAKMAEKEIMSNDI